MYLPPQDVGPFRYALKEGDLPLWFSQRHGCWCRLWRRAPEPVPAAPRILAQTHHFFAAQSAPGATLAELLAAVPADDIFHPIRAFIFGVLDRARWDVGHAEWTDVDFASVHLGFDDVVRLEWAVPLVPFNSYDYTDRSTRRMVLDANHERAEQTTRRIARSLGVSVPSPNAGAPACVRGDLARLLRNVFPKRFERADAFLQQSGLQRLVEAAPTALHGPTPELLGYRERSTEPHTAEERAAHREHERREAEARRCVTTRPSAFARLGRALARGVNDEPDEFGFTVDGSSDFAVEFSIARGSALSDWEPSWWHDMPEIRYERRALWLKQRRGSDTTSVFGETSASAVAARAEAERHDARVDATILPTGGARPSAYLLLAEVYAHYLPALVSEGDPRAHGRALLEQGAFDTPLGEWRRDGLFSLECGLYLALLASDYAVTQAHWRTRWTEMDNGITPEERTENAARRPPRLPSPTTKQSAPFEVKCGERRDAARKSRLYDKLCVFNIGRHTPPPRAGFGAPSLAQVEACVAEIGCAFPLMGHPGETTMVKEDATTRAETLIRISAELFRDGRLEVATARGVMAWDRFGKSIAPRGQPVESISMRLHRPPTERQRRQFEEFTGYPLVDLPGLVRGVFRSQGPNGPGNGSRPPSSTIVWGLKPDGSIQVEDSNRWYHEARTLNIPR